jgi:pyruvate formate lyase activating enzyme
MRSQSSPGVVRGEFHTRLDDGRVRCDVCPRACTMHEGQRGFCFVRMAHDGEVVLTSYGRSSGFCIDPIEKKPLNHFFPGSAVLSFGTAGCNLGCRFCQNWDISKARELATLSSHASPDAIAKAAAAAGCRSVAFTYNDPVVFLEYAVDTAAACHEQGIAAVAVSAGYITPKARERFFASMDATNIDLKAFDPRFYSKLCFAELEPIKETLIYVRHETKVWLEVATLLIPGQNDSEAEVGALCDWMLAALGPTVPLHFTAFHPDFKMVDLGPTPAATLTRARAQALACGLQNVYTGNVHDPEGQSTRCPTCKAVVIGRDGYDIGSWAMDAHGACRACGTPIAGRFAARPGTWGARRQPLQIEASDEIPSSC